MDKRRSSTEGTFSPMKSLDETTKVSIGLLIIFVGGVSWLATMHSQVLANTQEIREIKLELKELREIKGDLSVARADLKRILRKLGEE